MNSQQSDSNTLQEETYLSGSAEKILVTGSAGLLGTVLIKQLLANGKKIRAIYNKTALTGLDHDHLEQMQCDILDVVALEDAMQGISHVYHCAGLVSFAPRKRYQLFKINVEGTANVVNAALSAGVKKLVHVSSVAALGRIRENEPINENMQWTPSTSNSTYGHSKFLGEMEVWRGIAEGLEAVIVNPTVILGAGNWNDGSTGIFKSVYNEFPWYADGTTGFADVRDVCRAMILLMESPVSSERFIISAENASYSDVFFQIADAFGKKRPSRKVTAFMAGLVWRIESIKSKFSGHDPLLTKETAATAMAKVNFDNSKLKKFLPGFEYIPLKDTIVYACGLLQQKLNIL